MFSYFLHLAELLLKFQWFSLWNTKKAKHRLKISTSGISFLLCSLFLTNCQCSSVGYNQGYAPEQPIPFSHKLHAGDYKIPCVYCHTQVEVSKHSAIPSLNICMNCHIMVATDKEPIKKLQKKYYDGQTIQWVKVHMLPDHVKFNHKRHVHRFSEAKDRYPACILCHGEVKKMDVIKQESILSMGECVNCHRKQDPPGPTNCSDCHH